MASISDMLLGLGNQRFQQQNRDWNNFIKPLLIALGLKDPEQAMSVLGPIFQQMFAQDVEQIGQSFAGGQIATNMYGQMNPGQFYQSAADFYQPSGISPWWGIAQAFLGAGGGAMQGLLSNPGSG